MSMQLHEESVQVMIGTRVPEEVKQRLEEEAQENGISFSKQVSNALLERWELQAELERVGEDLQLYMDLNQSNTEKIKTLRIQNQKAVDDLMAEVQQRLERFVRYLDNKYNIFTSKEYREKLKKVFNEPLT